MERNCASCDRGRHSPSGKVCCSLLNSPEMIGLSCGASEEDVLEAISKVIPASATLYRGWGYPNRRHGVEKGDGTVMSGLMVNEMFLLDPDAVCGEFKTRPDMANHAHRREADGCRSLTS